jgi:hypothetical protein
MIRVPMVSMYEYASLSDGMCHSVVGNTADMCQSFYTQKCML